MANRRARKWNFKFFRKPGRFLMKLGFRAIPLGLMAAALCFIFFGVRQMLHADPYFRIERITVFPSGLLNSSEYRFLEDETRGRSLFEIDLRKMSKNLEKNPKIKRAEVVRILPSQLNVFLTTRLPFIQVQLEPEGPYYSVADDQLILSRVEAPHPNLMVLEDFNVQKKSYSMGTFYQNKYFQELFRIFESLKSDPLLNQETVSKLGMDHLGNLTLILKDGIELRIGKELTLSEGARLVLASVLRSKERSQILYVDLRYRDMIVKKKSSTLDNPDFTRNTR